jgi:hypothetical protein
MLAQESVMDVNKEREAFEKHASKFFKTNEAFEDDGENYVYDEVKFMWDCWLAAKAQAVPEGFVLVPKEPTLKMSIAYQKNAIAPVSSLSISGYKAMIDEVLQ